MSTRRRKLSPRGQPRCSNTSWRGVEVSLVSPPQRCSLVLAWASVWSLCRSVLTRSAEIEGAEFPHELRTKVATAATCSSLSFQPNAGMVDGVGRLSVVTVRAPSRMARIVLVGSSDCTFALPLSGGNMRGTPPDGSATELSRGEACLAALRLCPLGPGPLPVPAFGAAILAGKLAIQKERNAGFSGTWAELVLRDKPRDRSLDEFHFLSAEKTVGTGRCRQRRIGLPGSPWHFARYGSGTHEAR